MKPDNQQLLPCPFKRRFENKFTKTDNCWNWTASTNGKRNYGTMFYEGRSQLAHRISYKLYKGEIPAGLTIDHLCNNTLCVNPDHLALATQKDNNLRGNSATAKNKRKTHCARGHALNGANVRMIERKDGVRRKCKECGRADSLKHFYKKRAALAALGIVEGGGE